MSTRLVVRAVVAAWFAVCIGTAAAPAFAQGAPLSGKVTSDREGPMEGVLVSAKKAGSKKSVGGGATKGGSKGASGSAKKGGAATKGGGTKGGGKKGGAKKGGAKKSARGGKGIVRRVLAGAAAGLVSGAVAAALPPLEKEAGIQEAGSGGGSQSGGGESSGEGGSQG